jgi:hypothetical protein
LKLMRDPGRTSIRQFAPAAGCQAVPPPPPRCSQLVEQFAKYMPNDFPDVFKVHVLGLNDWVVGSMGGTLNLLFGAVMLLLVIRMRKCLDSAAGAGHCAAA